MGYQWGIRRPQLENWEWAIQITNHNKGWCSLHMMKEHCLTHYLWILMRQSSCSWMFCKFPIRKRCTLSIIWVHTSSGWSESVSSFLHPQISSIITRVYWRNVGRIAGLFWSWMTVFVCNGPMLKHLQGSVLGSILQSMYNIISYHIDMI